MNEHITWFDYDKMPNLNASLQVGDMAYYTPVSQVGGFNSASKSSIKQLGRVKDIRLIDTEALDTTPGSGLVKANEAYVQFFDPGNDYNSGYLGYGCGGVGYFDCPEDPSIITLSKTYKEAGIIPGMAVNIGIADELTSTGTLNDYSTSVLKHQASNDTNDELIFVKSVNPNGDNDYQIEIGQYNYVTGEYTYDSNDETAEVLPNSQTVNYGSGNKKALTNYISLGKNFNGINSYPTLSQEFQARPTRLKFSFDNIPQPALIAIGQDVYKHYPYSQHTNADGAVDGTLMTSDTPGSLSPWYGKTKFWMITTELDVNSTGASVGDFLMFSKDNAVNMSSPKGYYAKAVIENDSKVKSEMFAISVDGYMSSK